MQEDIDKDTWQAELLRHTPGMLCVTEAGGSARYHRLRFNFPGAAPTLEDDLHLQTSAISRLELH